QKSLLDAVLNAMEGSPDSDAKPDSAKKAEKGAKKNHGGNGTGKGGADAPKGEVLAASPGADGSQSPVDLKSADTGSGDAGDAGDTGSDDSSSPVDLKSSDTGSGESSVPGDAGTAAKLGLSNPGDINQFLMMVLLACYQDGQQNLLDMAHKLQATNDHKKDIR